MNRLILILITLFLFCSHHVLAQQTRVELGDKYFDQLAYNKAIALYKRSLERKENRDWKIYAKLADCYYYTSRPALALEYYEEALRRKRAIDESYYLKYALSLQAAGRSKDSILNAYREYRTRIGDTTQIDFRTYQNKNESELENLSWINSDRGDFGPFIYDETLYFVSSRENPIKKNRFNKRLYEWNGQPYLDIFATKNYKKRDSLLPTVTAADSSLMAINTMAHESRVAITSDGKRMYFSSGMVDDKGNPTFNKAGTSVLQLRRATKIGDQWVETPKDLEVMKDLNFDDYSVGNPALTPDDKKLFFVSCAPFPWAKGQTDIYYVDIVNDSVFSQVKPIPHINTDGRESFPHVSYDGTLYFSSDGMYLDQTNRGLLGFGLLDIYAVQNINAVLEENAAVRIDHLNSPINSDKDDFAIFIDQPKDDKINEAIAYFSSNREVDSSRGDDDLYRTKITLKNTISGLVANANDQNPLSSAMIELIDAEGMVKQTVLSDANGKFKFDVPKGKNFRIRASKAYFNDDLANYSIDDLNESIQLNLEPLPCEFSKHIQFENDSAEIPFQAKIDLLPLLEILYTNPEVQIKIESYTDSRAPKAYSNLVLSQMRADSTKAYLISVGVNEDQIVSAIGYGNKCLVVSDEDIAKSPPSARNDLHALNRRSKIVFTHCEDLRPCQSKSN